MKSTSTMTEAIRSSARAMYRINASMSAEHLRDIIQLFEKEDMKFNVKQEMMDEMIDGVAGQVDDEEEETKIIEQVLDEIGIDLGIDLGNAPQTSEASRSSPLPRVITQHALSLGNDRPSPSTATPSNTNHLLSPSEDTANTSPKPVPDGFDALQERLDRLIKQNPVLPGDSKGGNDE